MAEDAERAPAPRQLDFGSAAQAARIESTIGPKRHARANQEGSMATRDEIADSIAGMAIFVDLARPQLMGVASRFEEAFFPKDARVLRQGLTGSGFYIILDGDADVIADGQKRATLARGEFFGEVSVLLGEPPIADIVATRPLRCIVLGGPDVEGFLVDHPRVMYRMLQAAARRLRAANIRVAQA
jgi:CRP-like cAMP-binding protein